MSNVNDISNIAVKATAASIDIEMSCLEVRHLLDAIRDRLDGLNEAPGRMDAGTIDALGAIYCFVNCIKRNINDVIDGHCAGKKVPE